MASLNWIGKEAVVGHHREVPYHLLKGDAALSVGEDGGVGSGNLLVQGDNLLALKALLPYYAGRVKCIYIDPPYNTGNEGWSYNDNVNSPEIRQWLGKVVGKEGETLDRHDRWLCMMYPRLALLRAFLTSDGVILISIGKHELGHLRLLCDEIFGTQCLVEVFIWNTEGHSENQERVNATHEYILAYERMPGSANTLNVIDPNVPPDSKIRRDFAENSITKNGRGNPPSIIELPVGFPCTEPTLDLPPSPEAAAIQQEADASGYITRQMSAKHKAAYPLRLDEMTVRAGVLCKPCRVFSGWASARKLAEFIEAGCKPLDDDGTRLSYALSNGGVIYYRREGRQSRYVETVLREMGTTEKNKYELEDMGVHFDYPKPKELLSYLLSVFTEKDDIVMDSFLGSGTTGHAALLLNSKDGGQRRFIGIEMDFRNASEAAARRLRSVVNGYTSTRGGQRREITGTGGGFRYATLCEPLFDERGRIFDGVRFAELAAHVFFTETGEPLPKTVNGKKSPLIGVCHGIAYYLLFNGVLGDKRPEGGNVLTSDVLGELPKHDGQRVVFGEACRLGAERLKRVGVTFRHIPYQIKIS